MKTEATTPDDSKLANRDPITGTPGAHPVGVGVGAISAGAAAGAAGGAVAGPIGAVVGAVAGGIAGGLAGKAVAEKIDPTIESTYWRDNYLNRSYVETSVLYPEYEPAYRYGWESVEIYPDPDSDFDEIEPQLAENWNARRGSSKLSWERARNAVRDARDRVFHNRKRR